ncbi:kinase-like domain-containing protein [Geopyxis carbonaria]|nr:kinase-like domain-containing protein [Geopyxis carbonaria]
MSERDSIILPVSSPSNTESKPSLSINDTPLRRLFVLATLRILSRFLHRRGPVVMFSNLCIKCGSLSQPAEAATMQFVAKHTSIPVPKVHCAFERNGMRYILMERVQGHTLRHGWLERSVESKEKILAQIKNMVDQIRRIPPPSGQGISNVAGGPLFDERLAGVSYHGPFDNVQDFHRHLREGYEGRNEDPPDVRRLVEWHNQSCAKPTFTHGDLNTMNIIVRGDEVVGIIDWETAGWWPDYWEYTSAWHVNPYDEFWREEVDKFVEPKVEELDIEKLRRKFFGDF